jgi:hypothetical protein
MLLIAFNLIITAIISDVKINDRPDKVRELVGGSMDLFVGKYVFLNNIYITSSILSFVSIWITTALLMNYYRDKLIINAIAYWFILSIPLFYFLSNYLYKFILTNILASYLTTDPITVSIILTVFLTLSKPIGGLTFAVAFWKISNTTRYEKKCKNIHDHFWMGNSFNIWCRSGSSTNTTPISLFRIGLVTLTVLNIGAFLMLLGIYSSATLVSANNELRRFIHKQALESKLLSLIGHAEMENEIQRTVTKITQNLDTLGEREKTEVEVDEDELKKYVDLVVREVKNKDRNIKKP